MSSKSPTPLDLTALTIDELLNEFQKLPDSARWPLPEAYYENYGLKKPQPQSVAEIASYNPMAYSFGSKSIEIRGPAEGGVREINEFLTLPVDIKRLNEETGELEEYPNAQIKDQTVCDKHQCLTIDLSNLPTEDNEKEIQPS